MSGIYVVFIIFMLFILYNYLYVSEGANFEATSYTKSINDLLSSGKFNSIDITGNELKLGNEKTSLSGKKYGNEWLVLNPNNNYKDGVFVESKLKIGLGDKQLCIGDTCIDQPELQLIKDVVSGNKNIYIYKPNDYNKYLYAGDGISYGEAGDNDEQKQAHGSWRITTEIPKLQKTCAGYATSCSF